MTETVDVLVVEDDPYDVELIAHELAQHYPKVRVKWISDGERALRFLLDDAQAADPPRLVLLDLNLPKLDGFGVLERLRNDPRTAFVPVVVLTGGSPESSRLRRAYERGANSYVAKPTNHEDYVRAVRTVAGYWLQQNVPPGQ